VGQVTSHFESAYFEFRRVFDKVEIFHKPWEQCTAIPSQGTKASDLAGPNYQGIEPATGVVSHKLRFPQASKKVIANGSSVVLSPSSSRIFK
jgi:hypothetical protein